MGGSSHRRKDLPPEIIDLINSKLKSVKIEKKFDKNGSRKRSTGGVISNQPLICGGFIDNDDRIKAKHVSFIGMPNHYFKIMIPRSFASSVVMNDSYIWVTGGCSKEGLEKSTEIISLDQPPVSGPDLPFTVSHHSMVLVDPKTIYLIGGFQEYHQRSNKTWIIDPTNNFQIKVGPSLNIGRTSFSCSKMKIEGRIFLVVAGGVGDSLTPPTTMGDPGDEYLDSVELLDITCPQKGWEMGNFNLILSAFVFVFSKYQ